MAMRPPASIGMRLAEVDTPALVIDLDAFEANLKRMADFAGRSGIRVRPHAKTHKSPDIAKRQVALGAVGVCCQKVSEAEAMVDGGIGDVLISNEVAGKAKLARLAALAKRATVGVCVDDVDSVAELEAAADEAGSMLDVLVEIDVGGGRCGTTPGAAAAHIAVQVARARHLCFAGLQAYHGSAQHVRAASDRRDQIAQAALPPQGLHRLQHLLARPLLAHLPAHRSGERGENGRRLAPAATGDRLLHDAVEVGG